MSKRTILSPFKVEYLRSNDTWFVISYENSPRLARRACRDIAKLHGKGRVLDNPHRPGGTGVVVYEYSREEPT